MSSVRGLLAGLVRLAGRSGFLSLLSAIVIFTAVSCNMLAPAPTPLPTVSPQQHVLFHNGTILTTDGANPRAEALEIRGQKITAVGHDQEILALQQAGTRVVDLDGRTLMPGFVDAHTHLFNDAERHFDLSLTEVQQLALQNGITTIGNLYINKRFLKEMQEFEAAGQLRIRTSLYLVATDPCGEPQGDWWQAHSPTRTAGEMLRIGGVKLFTDGGTCGAPALSYELRPGEGLGDLFFTQEELNAQVAAVHGAGYQAAIHAIGDRGIEQAQKAIAAALDGRPNTPRHRIEHNSVIRPELLPRYGEIGAIPVLFGLYPTCQPFGPLPPPQYRTWEWPYRALLDANPHLPVAWHGDDPFFGRVRPLDDLYSLLTRNGVGEDGQICEAPHWQGQHTITAQEALPMMTVNAAYALFREEEVGSVTSGKYADLIVLSDNPLTADPQAIPQIDVWLTMVGGRVEYCDPDHQEVCP